MNDPYQWFRDLSKKEQRKHILDVTRMCLDGAPRSLARKIEIFLDAEEEVKHKFIEGGPKNEKGQLDPRPRCICGAVMPVGIKTGPAGWFYGHSELGWA